METRDGCVKWSAGKKGDGVMGAKRVDTPSEGREILGGIFAQIIISLCHGY